MHTCTCNSVTVSKCSIFTYITKKHTWIYIYIYIHIHILYMYIYIYIHTCNSVTASKCSIFCSHPPPRRNCPSWLWNRYDSFPWKSCIPEIHQIEKLRFPSISRYKFKLRFWFNLNLCCEDWISGLGGFWRCSIFSEIIRSSTIDSTNNCCQNLLISRLQCVAVGCSVLQRVAGCGCAATKQRYRKIVTTQHTAQRSTYDRFHDSLVVELIVFGKIFWWKILV